MSDTEYPSFKVGPSFKSTVSEAGKLLGEAEGLLRDYFIYNHKANSFQAQNALENADAIMNMLKTMREQWDKWDK